MKLIKHLIVFICLIVVPITNSQTLQGELLNDFPTLSKVYSTKNLKADHIFVVDRSGSMRNIWNKVIPSIASLISILPDGDYVSVIGFDSNVYDLVIPRTTNSDSKKILIQEIKNLSRPKGQKTDLFAALNKTLEEINRPNSNHLKFVYFITDLLNDPPSSSKWKTTQQLNQLSSKYENIVEKPNINLTVYTLQLPLSNKAGKDYDKFSSILHGNSKRILLDTGTLESWFERQKLELQRMKLHALVQESLSRKLELNSLHCDENNIEVEIRNPYPFEIKILALTAVSDEYGKVTQNFEKMILPNESISMKLDSFSGLESETSIILTETQLDANLKIEYLLKPESEFGKLNIKTLRIEEFNDLNLLFTTGYPLYLIISAIIIPLVLIYFLISPCLKSVKTFNNRTVNISMSFDGKMQNLTKTKLAPSKQTIEIRNSIIKDPVKDLETFKIFIEPVKPTFPFCRSPKRGTYILADSKFPLYIEKYERGKIVKKPIQVNLKHTNPINIIQPIVIKGSYLGAIKMHDIEIRINV